MTPPAVAFTIDLVTTSGPALNDEHEQRLALAGRRLRLDAATAELAGELRRRMVEALLIKGPSVARWLYADPATRPYGDIDLLVAPGSGPLASEVLEQLGFARVTVDLSKSRPRAAVEWRRPRDGVEVDLHTTFPGAEGDLWTVLWPDAERLDVADEEVDVPSIPGRLLLVGLHAANHGEIGRQAMADLDLALEQVDPEAWERAAALATRAGALPAFLAGLGLRASGTDLVERLGTGAALTLRTAVTVESPREAVRSVALGIDWLVSRPGWRAKVAYVAEKVWPPKEWIAERYKTSAGRFGVARARARRLAWLVTNVPSGARMWLRARRRARREGEG